MQYLLGGLFFFASFFVFPFGTRAALLYIDPGEVTVLRGDTVTLSLRLDTDEGECVNTVDAVISYEAGIRAVDVSRGSSILNLWVEDPKIDEKNRIITFAGGIIGGYCGRAAGDPSLTNIIADIVFQSPGFAVGGADTSDIPHVTITDASSVLVNDGFGTEAVLRTQNAVVMLSDTPGNERTDLWRDRISEDVLPPADFAVTLSKDASAFSEQYFITWNTQDKQSGIDHYEVMEEPLEDLYAFRWGRADAPWVTAESPYVLKDQTLNSTIRVKAIDKAGNETITVLIPDDAVRSLSRDRILTFAIVGGIVFILVLLIAYVLIERKRRVLASYEHHHEE
jgi:hypothetical protein